jgi:hypothetical protein
LHPFEDLLGELGAIVGIERRADDARHHVLAIELLGSRNVRGLRALD